jgi:hypothetical protein
VQIAVLELQDVFAGAGHLLYLADCGGTVVGMDEFNDGSGLYLFSAPAQGLGERRTDACEVPVHCPDSQYVE